MKRLRRHGSLSEMRCIAQGVKFTTTMSYRARNNVVWCHCNLPNPEERTTMYQTIFELENTVGNWLNFPKSPEIEIIIGEAPTWTDYEPRGPWRSYNHWYKRITSTTRGWNGVRSSTTLRFKAMLLYELMAHQTLIRKVTGSCEILPAGSHGPEHSTWAASRFDTLRWADKT
jgi:hypothetical protein